jgi:tetratricopeptide (TPR) repeat protein
VGLAEQRRFDEAERMVAAALRDLAALPEARTAEVDCLVGEAFLASAKGDGARAIAAGERAVAIEESRPGAPGHGFRARFELATAYLVGERRLSAVRAYRELLAELEMQGLGQTRDAATVLHNWSVTLQRGRQYLQALPIAERAVRIAEERDTEGGAPVLELRGLANALCKVGRLAECVRYHDVAVVKARAAGSRRRLADALRAAGGAYTQAGGFDRAAATLREARALQAASADATPNDASMLDLAFGRLELARGHHQAALDLAARGLARESDAARPLEDTVSFLLLVAEARNAIGDAQAARTAAERALALARGRLGEMTHSSDVGQAHLELGVALAAQGDVEAARAELRSALEHLRACLGPQAHHTQRALAQRGRLG